MLERIRGDVVHIRLDGGHALPLEAAGRARRLHRVVRRSPQLTRTRSTGPQADREQRREHELEADRPDQRGDEPGRIVARQHRPHRRDRERQRQNREQRRSGTNAPHATTATIDPATHAT